MKLKVKSTVETEVEVTLPAYTKSSCHFYKVYSEEKAIVVCTLNGHHEIGLVSPMNAFHDGHDVSNEEEFNKAFDKIGGILTMLKKN